jgi:hypothetical protein
MLNRLIVRFGFWPMPRNLPSILATDNTKGVDAATRSGNRAGDGRHCHYSQSRPSSAFLPDIPDLSVRPRIAEVRFADKPAKWFPRRGFSPAIGFLNDYRLKAGRIRGD